MTGRPTACPKLDELTPGRIESVSPIDADAALFNSSDFRMDTGWANPSADSGWARTTTSSMPSSAALSAANVSGFKTVSESVKAKTPISLLMIVNISFNHEKNHKMIGWPDPC